MKILTRILFLAAFSALSQNKPFQAVSVDTILAGKMSVRALLTDEKKIWYAADQGRYGFFDFYYNTTFEKRVVFDTLKPEFRSIAKTAQSIFIVNAGSPALLYQISKDGSKAKLVHRDTNKKIFYDSMAFWNDSEGIAVGDPTADCFSILITRDGGHSWEKTPCEKLPKIANGEAAFAASNTNIVVKGNKAWVVSGGTNARVFYSSDKGKTWEVFETPIIQGSQMTGIFTADFYDENIGVIAGGDYEKQNQNFGNKAITHDGGKTWQLISEHSGFGYASCVQFVPESHGLGMVSVGTSGLCYSADGGATWKRLLDDKRLYTIRFINSKTAFAAGKDKIIRIRFQ